MCFNDEKMYRCFFKVSLLVFEMLLHFFCLHFQWFIHKVSSFWQITSYIYKPILESSAKIYHISRSNTGSPLIARPLITRISLQHGFSKIWTPLIKRHILSIALFFQYNFIYFYYIFMKSTIPLIARISLQHGFSKIWIPLITRCILSIARFWNTFL